MLVRTIPLGHLAFDERTRSYIQNILDTNRVTYGTYSMRFEQEFAARHGTRHGVFCNSGSGALQVSLAALGERYGFCEGDEVAVPALTFIATSNAVLHSRLSPVFVDVDPMSYTMDPNELERRTTPRTRAVIPVHLFGLPCEMDAINDIAARKGLRVIEDACQAALAAYRGRPVGSLGEIGCFSTYVAHTVVSGVGGMITTNDQDLATVCRSLVFHGRNPGYLSIEDDDVKDSSRLHEVMDQRFSFIRLGFSFRLTEFEAAIGLGSLEREKEISAARQRNAESLIARLRPLEEYLQLPSWPSHVAHGFMIFPVVVRSGVSREKLMHFLEQRQIETRLMFPLLDQPIYRKLFGDLYKDYPVAHFLSRNGLYVACHEWLSSEDLDYMVGAFHEFFRGG